MKTVQAELVEAKKRVDELQCSLQRMTADFENYKKWAAREKADTIRFANEQIISRLLDIYESIEKAAHHPTSGGDLAAGVKLIHKEFTRLLKAEGLEPIDAVGKALDVSKHEVLMRKPDAAKPEDTVLEEIQRGYIFRSRVLKPAKVIVSETIKPADTTQATSQPLEQEEKT